MADVRTLAFSPDGQLLAAAYVTGVSLWSVAGWKEQACLHRAGYTTYLAFHPGGRSLALGEIRDAGCSWAWPLKVAEATSQIALWNLQSGPEAASPLGLPWSGAVYCVAFRPDARLLACSGLEPSVRLCSARTGRWLGALTGHAAAVYSVCFSPDGRMAATASRDNTVKLWDVPRLP